LVFKRGEATRGNGFGYFPRKESNPSCGGGTPLLSVEIARLARDTIQNLLLPGVQQNPLPGSAA
jgi:hypothetical protein